MALQSTLKVILNALYDSSLDLSKVLDQLDYQKVITLAAGTGAGQADKLWHDQRTLAPSASENLDLNAGGLTDAFGVVFTIAKLKAMLFFAAPGNANAVQVSRPAANMVPWLSATAFLSLGPGAVFGFLDPGAAGIATVTAGTGDLITVTNGAGGTSVTYDVVLIGTSA